MCWKKSSVVRRFTVAKTWLATYEILLAYPSRSYLTTERFPELISNQNILLNYIELNDPQSFPVFFLRNHQLNNHLLTKTCLKKVSTYLHSQSLNNTQLKFVFPYRIMDCILMEHLKYKHLFLVNLIINGKH